MSVPLRQQRPGRQRPCLRCSALAGAGSGKRELGFPFDLRYTCGTHARCFRASALWTAHACGTGCNLQLAPGPQLHGTGWMAQLHGTCWMAQAGWQGCMAAHRWHTMRARVWAPEQ
eukprot:325547-Chlamydomonas_euryale.AAC.3